MSAAPQPVPRLGSAGGLANARDLGEQLEGHQHPEGSLAFYRLLKEWSGRPGEVARTSTLRAHRMTSLCSDWVEIGAGALPPNLWLGVRGRELTAALDRVEAVRSLDPHPLYLHLILSPGQGEAFDWRALTRDMRLGQRHGHLRGIVVEVDGPATGAALYVLRGRWRGELETALQRAGASHLELVL